MRKAGLLFGLALLFCVAGWWTDQPSRDNQRTVANAQKQLHVLEEQIKESLRKVMELKSPEQFHESFIHQGEQDRGIAFFYFRNKQLQYWSDNEIALLPSISVDSIKDESILTLSNGIYESFKTSKLIGTDTIDAIGLLTIRKQYAYENRYLVNSFNPFLKLEHAYPDERGTPVYADNGQMVVSISFTENEGGNSRIPALLYLLGYLFFLAALMIIALSPAGPIPKGRAGGGRGWKYFIVIISLLLFRAAQLWLQLPAALYHTDFFSPKYYAASMLFRSIGDFFLNSITIFCIAVIIHRYAIKKITGSLLKVVGIVAIIVISFFLHKLIAGLLVNSKIKLSISNIAELDLISFVALASVMVLLWSLFLAASAIFKWQSTSARITALILFALYSTFTISYYSHNREKENMKVMSERLNFFAALPAVTDSTTLNSIGEELQQRLMQQSEGFPELFRSKSSQRSNDVSYSFARYNNGALVYVYGNYPYAFTPAGFEAASNGEYSFLKINDYSHLVYKPSAGTTIIVSRPLDPWVSNISLFSYVLLFFSVFYFPVTGFGKKLDTLKERIQFTIVTLVVASFILIGIGTIYYLINKYDIDQDKNVLGRVNSLWFVINDKLQLQENLSALPADTGKAALSEVATDLNVDFNVFNERGILFYSSQGKIFDKGIISSLMNPEAMFELTTNNRTQYVHKENIGKLEYTAAYAPFTERNGKIIGYLNVPYFEKQNELKKEISGFLSALVNIYVLLLVLAILLSIFIASKISQPYAEQLARSEKESAWREMARQVAHEIKNPLTPMKLNIQHLQRAWSEGREDINDMFQRISNSLIEQINSLSRIASEFSNFAQMPVGTKELVDIDAVVKSVLNLFANVGVEINYESFEGKNVIADREQLSRVLSNIIQNSIQSIPDNKKGIIRVAIETTNGTHLISIQDNGRGIPSDLQTKIFTPNFTTKSSGMGLGLPIAKNIIEGLNGRLWFTTDAGRGTTFFIELPKS